VRPSDLRHPVRFFREFFVETWKRMDEEAEEARRTRREAGLGYDWRPLVALLSGGLFLTLMEYFGMPRNWHQLVHWLADMEKEGAMDGTFWQDLRPWDHFRPSRWGPLSNHVYWGVWRALGFLVFPIVVIKLSRQRIRDQFLSTEGFFEHLWIYGLALLIVLGCVIGVSYTEGFQEYYPFYDRSSRSWGDFLIWEAFYILQFLSLEFFFRGWWLKAGQEAMGSTAIFAMVVPYVMIHFGKEFPETLGAIFAGLFLGTLAMRTRSIWGGFLVHCGVAIAMDVAALLQTTGLPSVWWPELPPQ